MAQQELDLIQFTSCIAAQAGAGPAQVVRGQVINSRSFRAVLHDVPHDPFCYTASPSLAGPANAPKDTAFAYAGRSEPGIDDTLDPIRNGHRPNMSTFADQIHDGPVIVTALKMCEVQFYRLFPPQAAAPVPSLGFFRGQAIENRRSSVVEVWKAQRVLCGRLLGVTLFAAFHCWGLHARIK